MKSLKPLRVTMWLRPLTSMTRQLSLKRPRKPHHRTDSPRPRLKAVLDAMLRDASPPDPQARLRLTLQAQRKANSLSKLRQRLNRAPLPNPLKLRGT